MSRYGHRVETDPYDQTYSPAIMDTGSSMFSAASHESGGDGAMHGRNYSHAGGSESGATPSFMPQGLATYGPSSAVREADGNGRFPPPTPPGNVPSSESSGSSKRRGVKAFLSKLKHSKSGKNSLAGSMSSLSSVATSAAGAPASTSSLPPVETTAPTFFAMPAAAPYPPPAAMPAAAPYPPPVASSHSDGAAASSYSAGVGEAGSGITRDASGALPPALSGSEEDAEVLRKLLAESKAMADAHAEQATLAGDDDDLARVLAESAWAAECEGVLRSVRGAADDIDTNLQMLESHCATLRSVQSELRASLAAAPSNRTQRQLREVEDEISAQDVRLAPLREAAGQLRAFEAHLLAELPPLGDAQMQKEQLFSGLRLRLEVCQLAGLLPSVSVEPGLGDSRTYGAPHPTHGADEPGFEEGRGRVDRGAADPRHLAAESEEGNTLEEAGDTPVLSVKRSYSGGAAAAAEAGVDDELSSMDQALADIRRTRAELEERLTTRASRPAGAAQARGAPADAEGVIAGVALASDAAVPEHPPTPSAEGSADAAAASAAAADALQFASVAAAARGADVPQGNGAASASSTPTTVDSRTPGSRRTIVDMYRAQRQGRTSDSLPATPAPPPASDGAAAAAGTSNLAAERHTASAARIAHKVRTASPATHEELRQLLGGIAVALDGLQPERRDALLSGPDWPAQRYEAMRQAVGVGMALEELAERQRGCALGEAAWHEQCARLYSLLETAKAEYAALAAQRDGLVARCAAQRVPFDTRAFAAARREGLGVAVRYMALVLQEIARVEAAGPPEEAAVRRVLQDLTDTLRVVSSAHTYAGSWDDGCREAYAQIRAAVVRYTRLCVALSAGKGKADAQAAGLPRVAGGDAGPGAGEAPSEARGSAGPGGVDVAVQG